MSSNAPDPREITHVIQRVDHLGSASERLFSRLYQGLGRKSRAESEPSRQLRDHNLLLRDKLNRHAEEIERLKAVLNSIDEGVIMQDTEGRLVLMNAAAHKLLGGYRSFWQSELGMMFNQYRDITQLDTELSPLSEPRRLEINDRILGAQLAAVADNKGRRLGTLIVLRDVTSDVLAEKLKDQFITAISHELRTPMAVIKGVSEVVMAQTETDGKPAPRLLDTLSRNVDILDRMIVELLDISELSTGNFLVRQDVLDLEPLIWNTIRGVQPEARRSQIEILVMARDLERLRVRGDDQRLRWALGHLIQNGIRYTEPGGHVVLAINRGEDSYIAIQVIDNGVGISERDLPNIFDRFYRGQARATSGKLLDPRGLGQGLFIARKVVEAHNGYLTVRSQPGQGSNFTMRLPQAVTAAP